MRVSSVRFDADAKTFRLANGKTIRTHRYSCLGPGDDVIVRPGGAAFAQCENGLARILPSYSAKTSIRFGCRDLKLLIKEPQSAEELEGCLRLEDYHYRGTVLHGRRVPLIVTSSDPLLPRVLGYIELATAFIMNRPRAVLLNATFHERTSGINWSSWKKDTVRRYTNLVVRIARCVVSPEFRGLGLAGLLVEHATRFARTHWHIARLKPLFIEITADMLRYVPFVESAGMHYIGDTQGNLARISKDMNYILRNFSRVTSGEILKQESAGIVDLQVFYATQLKQIQRTHQLSQDQLLKLLIRSPHQLSDDNWSLLHRIFRLPKPTFLKGLTGTAERFVRKRLRTLDIPIRYPVRRPPEHIPSLRSALKVSDCTLQMTAPLLRTRSTRKIQQAFGVSRDSLTTTLFANLNFEIRPGDLVLLCGPSGAGKTTLLSVLSQRLQDPNYQSSGLSGTIQTPTKANVSTLVPLSSSRPLINALGKVSFDQALFSLNVSGLAEAHLYVKRFRELSNGQRYRAMVARLIATSADIWIADEFCATLDPLTANIVSRNLRRCAKHLGTTVILAAANWSEFIHELRPDLVVHLRAPWDCRVFRWSEFEQAMKRSHLLARQGGSLKRDVDRLRTA